MHLSLASMHSSFIWLLCSFSFITLQTVEASLGACPGGFPAQFASLFKGYKPASSYCASSYPVSTATIQKIYPAKTIVRTDFIGTATVVASTATLTLTVPATTLLSTEIDTITNTETITLTSTSTDSGTTTTTATTTSIAAHVGARDVNQDQIFNSLLANDGYLSSVCACLRVTSTLTTSITRTSTKIISATSTNLVNQTLTSTVTPTITSTLTSFVTFTETETTTTVVQPTTSTATQPHSITLSSSGTRYDGSTLIGNIYSNSALIFGTLSSDYTKDKFTLDPNTGYLYVDGNTQAQVCARYAFRGRKRGNGPLMPLNPAYLMTCLPEQTSDDGFAPLVCLVDSGNVMHCHIDAVGLGQTWGILQMYPSDRDEDDALMIGSSLRMKPVVLNWNSGTSSSPIAVSPSTTATTDLTACTQGAIAQPSGGCDCKYTQSCGTLAAASVNSIGNAQTYLQCMTQCDNDQHCSAFEFDGSSPVATVGGDPFYRCNMYYSSNINPVASLGSNQSVGYVVPGSCPSCSKSGSAATQR